MRIEIATVLAAFAWLGLASAQAIAPDEWGARTLPYMPLLPLTLRTQVDLVEVPVVVRDGQHRAIAGLTRDNFEIDDNGRKQRIAAFSVENLAAPGHTAHGAKPAGIPAAPTEEKGGSRRRFVALCFDDLNMDFLTLKEVREAATRFVKTALDSRRPRGGGHRGAVAGSPIHRRCPQAD